MSERQGFLVRNGFVLTSALAIVVLFVLFCSTVNGAVDRASQRRAGALDSARASALAGAAPAAPRFALNASTR